MARFLANTSFDGESALRLRGRQIGKLAIFGCHAACPGIHKISSIHIISSTHQRTNPKPSTEYHSPRNPSPYTNPNSLHQRGISFHSHLWLLRNAAAALIPPRALPNPSFLRIRATNLNPTITQNRSRRKAYSEPVPVARGMRSSQSLQVVPRAATTSLSLSLFRHRQVTALPRHHRPYSPCLRYRLPVTAFP